MCPGNGGVCSRRGRLLCRGAPGGRDGLASTACPGERERMMGSVSGNMLEPWQPKLSLFSSAGLTGPKVSDTNVLRITFCANTSFKPSATSIISFSPYSSCPGCHSTHWFLCVPPSHPRGDGDVENLGMGSVTGTRWGRPSWSGQGGKAPVNSPFNMAINNFGSF